jgi:hypothetical protein
VLVERRSLGVAEQGCRALRLPERHQYSEFLLASCRRWQRQVGTCRVEHLQCYLEVLRPFAPYTIGAKDKYHDRVGTERTEPANHRVEDCIGASACYQRRVERQVRLDLIAERSANEAMAINDEDSTSPFGSRHRLADCFRGFQPLHSIRHRMRTNAGAPASP